MPAPPYGAAQGREPVDSVDPSGEAVHTFMQHRTEDLLPAMDQMAGLIPQGSSGIVTDHPSGRLAARGQPTPHG